MAVRGSFWSVLPLDIQQLYIEAEHRWLQPAEICEIIQNHKNFLISSEPPTMPASIIDKTYSDGGSLFLFNRKVVRYFRFDGHIWRKKADRKTVREIHKMLKVENVDVLHSYCAHGEENERFQRRSYYMLDKDLMQIVFVHYLEVKDKAKNSSPSKSLVVVHDKENSANISPSPSCGENAGSVNAAEAQQPSSRSQAIDESPPQMQSIPVTNGING